MDIAPPLRAMLEGCLLWTGFGGVTVPGLVSVPHAIRPSSRLVCRFLLQSRRCARRWALRSSAAVRGPLATAVGSRRPPAGRRHPGAALGVSLPRNSSPGRGFPDPVSPSADADTE